MFKQIKSQESTVKSQESLPVKPQEFSTQDSQTDPTLEPIENKSKKIVDLPYYIDVEKYGDNKTKISLVRIDSEHTGPTEPIDQYYQLYEKSVKMIGLMLTLQYAIQNQQDFTNLSFTNQVYSLLLPTVLGYSFGKNITYMSMLYKVYKSFM